MDSNTHSAKQPTSPSARQSDGLAAFTAAVDALAAQNLTGFPDAVRAQRVLGLRRLLDRLEGHWLAELAAVDARGAAGAEDGVQAASTAGWLRSRLRLGAEASSQVRTARALFRGPLTQTGQALTDGELSPAHASVVASGTQELPTQIAVEAEPVLVEAARRLDPPRLRRVIGHLVQVADSEGAEDKADRQHERRGLWLASTLEGMVALEGLLEPEAGQTLLAALEPLACPARAADTRSGSQRRADALTELARRALEGGRLPQTGGVRPQLLVTVDLASLLGHGGVGGEAGWAGPLAPEGCRRLACDGAVTRVLVSRHPTSPHRASGQVPCGLEIQDSDGHHSGGHHHRGGQGDGGGHDVPGSDGWLTRRLRTVAALLPPILGGAPCQPLDLGRTTRVVTAGQRHALAVRDGGCVVPDCQRPLAGCEAQHRWHWLDGGPTDLANLVLLCRAQHRAVHEGGWQLTRQPDGRLTASAPQRSHRRHPHHRRHHTAA